MNDVAIARVRANVDTVTAQAHEQLSALQQQVAGDLAAGKQLFTSQIESLLERQQQVRVLDQLNRRVVGKTTDAELAGKLRDYADDVISQLTYSSGRSTSQVQNAEHDAERAALGFALRLVRRSLERLSA